ncbi:MAG: radical SAM protein, partial [Verrucomicrobia bacterium]|nr:radical SAM protein [Verrucomicrobiota bacterium]
SNSPASAFWPPLAFASMAAMLRQRLPDLCVEILDAPALEMGWRSLAAEIHRRCPTFVGIGEEAVSCVEGLRLARLAKECGARVIAGGCFFGQVAPQALATGLIDVVVHGEGEVTLVELVQALREGSTGALAKVNGISFLAGEPAPDQVTQIFNLPYRRFSTCERPDETNAPARDERSADCKSAIQQITNLRYANSGEVVTTPPRQLVSDLDTLPLPAYDLLPMDRYGARSVNHPRLAAIELGRGCFGSCDFCVLWRQMGRFAGDRLVPQLRVKSPERLLEEIRLLVHRYHRGYLGWVDPCFNADARVPGQLAELLLRDGIHVGQSAWVRTDAMVRDAHSGALAHCVRSGLNEVYLGIERPDGESLSSLHKTSGVEHAREALHILRSQFPEVLAIGSFIYGLPGDSPRTIRAIHRFVSELDLDQFFFIPLTPLPGTSEWRTELWDPTGESFREYNFLPTGRPHGRHAELERALLWSLLTHWPWTRVRGYLRGLLPGDARRRRVQWRLAVRGAQVHLRRMLHNALGGGHEFGMVFPRWYES